MTDDPAELLTPDERVINGIELLDSVDMEGWRDVLWANIDSLDVSSAGSCALYFLYGSYEDGCRSLSIWSRDDQGRDSAWYGFADENDTEAWVRYLTAYFA
jgi:hypothetical protein